MRAMILGLWVLSTAAALGQEAQPPLLATPPETIYSDAQRDRDMSLSRRTVIEVLEPVDTTDDQFARWKRPICFNVYGLKPLAKYIIERRLKDIALQVGAPVDRQDPCEPNVTIAFTPDTDATLDSIESVRPELLPYYDMIAARVKQSQPVQAWYAVTAIDSTGREELIYDAYTNEPRPLSVANSAATRLNTGLNTALRSVVIVADTNVSLGRTAETLAGYFALLALAETRATSGCKEVSTIANLMAQDCQADLRPQAITNGDLALLTGLYLTPDDNLQRLQRNRIIGNMRRTLEKQATGK